MSGIPVVSVFTGAFGLDLGLERVGFRTVCAVEKDVATAETLRANRPDLDVRVADVADVGGSTLPAAKALVGGPPCQSFSVFGKRGGVSDPRGVGVLEFLRLVGEAGPEAFLMENVRGITTAPLDGRDGAEAYAGKGGLLLWLQEAYRALGYRTDTFVVNAANHGSPQIRERAFVVGNRVGGVAEFPERSRSDRAEEGLPPFATLEDAIGHGFEDPDPERMEFSARKLAYLRLVPPGGNWRCLPPEVQRESMGRAFGRKGGRAGFWRRLAWDHPSPAVTTTPNQAATSMCHPDETRALTVGECAAIQGFPPYWRFAGSVTRRCRQVGNAVPAPLGEAAGMALRSAMIPKGRHAEADRIAHLRPHVRTRRFKSRSESASVRKSP